MSKTASDSLHKLIKALTIPEKGYFKIYANYYSSSEDKIYLKIFELVDKQTIYNEETIKNQFPDKKTIQQFPRIKHYLYQLILKSLRQYNSGKTIDSLLYEMIASAKILKEKKLWNPFGKIISKSKKQAYQFERYSILLEIIELEKSDRRVSLSEGQKLFEEYQSICEKIAKNNEYRILDSKMLTLYAQEIGQIRTIVHESKFKNIIEHPLLSIDFKHATTDEKKWGHQILGFYQYIRGDYEASYQHRKALVKLYELESKNILLDEHYRRRYFRSLDNLLNTQIQLNKINEAKLCFQKIINPRTVYFILKEDSTTLIGAYINFINLFLKKGEFDSASIYSDKIHEIVFQEPYRKDTLVLVELILSFNMFYSYFGVGDYHKALKCINEILNKGNVSIRKDLLSLAQFVNIILHFEMGNLHTLEYLIKSTYRLLYKKEYLYKFEKLLLLYFKKLPDVNDNNELIQFFKKIRSSLSPLLNDPDERKMLEEFDFISWLDSKIENRPFAEIVREKAVQKKV